MIIYDLCCDQEHRFEGWFASAHDFDAQLHDDLVRCPQCDSAAVRRVPSAVAIALPSAGAAAPATATAFAAIPAGSQAMAIYRHLVTTMLAASEDVGGSFAEEARRIHYQEAPERAIFGQASEEDYESLRDEGIEVLRLPLPRKEDLS